MSRNLKRTHENDDGAGRARRRLIMSICPDDRDPTTEPEPKLWKPSLNVANKVVGSPASLQITEPVQLTKTNQPSRGSLQCKTSLQKSIHASILERVAACDIDEDEGPAVLEDNLEHVRKWVGELRPSSECYEKQPRSCNTPVPDVFPSTSRMMETDIVRIMQSVPDGSECDSDFNDEYSVDALAAVGGMTRNIPDDNELDEPTRNIVSSIERAMDDAIEQMVGIPSEFHWQADFDTFRGIQETFSGPTPGPIKDYDTPYDVFIDIWDKDIMEHIVRETNRYAKQTIDGKTAAGTLKPSSRLRRWTDTDVDEMYVFFAIFIFMGLDPRSSQHEYWKTSGYLEMPKFRQLMSFNRFILLNKFIHFADNHDVQDRSQSLGISAKLNKLAPVLVHLNSKFTSLYHLEQDIAIDESLTLFKGRLSWIQAIRSKAARFGIKSFELCESRTGYLSRFEIYAGKNSESADFVAPSVDLAGKSAQVVLHLLKGLEHKGHCVTMDNFYNCPALARHLKNLGFDCLGTLRVNRKNVPKDISQIPKNVQKGTIVARHSGDVSCIAWKDTKIVTLISTYHGTETYIGSKAGRELIKPIVVKDYNNTMGGVDLKDQKLSMYLVERKRCVKWYMKMFKRLLNVSVHNALVMLIGSLARRDMSLITHRDFRESLANSLVEKHRRSPQEILAPLEETTRMKKDIVHVPKYLDTKSRMLCHICLRKGIRKKVHLKCVTCNEAMCFEACWSDWHSMQQLPGKTVNVRKGRRIEK